MAEEREGGREGEGRGGRKGGKRGMERGRGGWVSARRERREEKINFHSIKYKDDL